MEQVQCACGCGQYRPKYDKKGRVRRYIKNHQNKDKTKNQIDAATATMNRVRPRIPWNKGKSYVHSSKKAYANKSAWNAALRRLYPDTCMRCGWHESSCDTHHILPKCNGGKYSIANGVILCPNCHRLADFGLIGVNELQAIKDAAVMTGEIV